METKTDAETSTVTKRSLGRILHWYLRNVDITHKQGREMEIAEMQIEAEKVTKRCNKEKEEGEHNAPVEELRATTALKRFEN